MNQDMKTAIQAVITQMMDKVMERVLKTDPFEPEKHHASKPLYAALVPDEIFKGSHFERRFVTPFGGIWEKLAVLAAEKGLGKCVQGHTIRGTIGDERLRRIQEILANLEHPDAAGKRTKPDWNSELEYVLAGKGEPIPVAVVCDIYAENTSTGERFAFELKAPLPNSDQTKQSKEKIFKLYAMDSQPINGAYYALPYNPYGKKEDYAWTFPARWFDMRQDPVVLIGAEFWDKIGGEGTYSAFIEAINEIGLPYRERIYREFLNIEPPVGALEPLL
jgi:hypothetical protein